MEPLKYFICLPDPRVIQGGPAVVKVTTLGRGACGFESSYSLSVPPRESARLTEDEMDYCFNRKKHERCEIGRLVKKRYHGNHVYKRLRQQTLQQIRLLAQLMLFLILTRLYELKLARC